MRMSRALAVLTAAAALAALPAAAAPQAARPGPTQKVAIEVTRAGFVPAAVQVKVGQPVTLVVTRTVERTCATDIVIKEYGVSRPLPLGKPVEVTFTPTKAGPIRYACAMDMIAGVLTAR